jgi:hypothetical protein
LFLLTLQHHLLVSSFGPSQSRLRLRSEFSRPLTMPLQKVFSLAERFSKFTQMKLW